MAEAAKDLLERYRPWRRHAEAGFWVAVLALQVIFNSLVTWMDIRRSQPGFSLWHPVAWEVTSALVVGALIPAIVAFEQRFPLRWETLRRNVGWHLAGSVAYCAVHVAGMLLLRELTYAAAGREYHAGSWLRVFAYEYLKDVRSYVLILVAVWSYRLLLLRLQGEARVLDPPEPPPAGRAAAPPPARPERFLVRKLRKEFLIAARDIEWVQAQGNYVGLHVNGHDYLLRSTLGDFLEQLEPSTFVRVHRSYVVNLDRVAEIEPLDDGDARLRMKDGGQVPCSRRYRDALAPRRDQLVR